MDPASTENTKKKIKKEKVEIKKSESNGTVKEADTKKGTIWFIALLLVLCTIWFIALLLVLCTIWFIALLLVLCTFDL